MAAGEPAFFTITEVARALNRRSKTVREWERLGKLPPRAMPIRDSHGRRIWTLEAYERLVRWFHEELRSPGSNLNGDDVSPEQDARIITAMRHPRRKGPKRQQPGRETSSSPRDRSSPG